MDQQDWELIDILFPERAAAARKAEECLERLMQTIASPPVIFPDLWGDSTDQGPKGAGPGEASTGPAKL